MSLNQAAHGRRAKSLCIVTELPVRLQAKSAKVRTDIVETRIVRIGSTTLRIRMSATGELIVDEPP